MAMCDNQNAQNWSEVASRYKQIPLVCDVCGADLFVEKRYILNDALLCRSCFLKECEKASHARH